MAIYGDGKHDSDNTESNNVATTFKVTLTFEDVMADSPKEAVDKIVKWIKKGVDDMIFDAENEITGDKFTVDLSEDEEDQVLPNND
jgi:hypothetical protein